MFRDMLPLRTIVVRHLCSQRRSRSFHSQDISIAGTKSVVSSGPPGRSAVTGHVATVFGCTGFLGRYLVSQLAKAGTQVIVPFREEDSKRHLKVTGDLGQVVPMEWDIRDEAAISECVRHSDIVYNLVARDYETKNFNYTDVNLTGAATIARISAANGVQRFVHVSHLNAADDSSSKFYQTKAEGEHAVRKVFPRSTIVRPGPMYGHEDRLLRSMAVWPSTWKLNDERTLLRPVHVLDVARALANINGLSASPQLLILPGPHTYTVEYLLELISSVTLNPSSRVPQLPKKLALLLSKISSLVWWPALGPDQIERRFIDDAHDSDNWDVLDMKPDSLERHALTYLQMYRTAENFTRPVVIPEADDKGLPISSVCTYMLKSVPS